MSAVNKICRVCGKEYEACRSAKGGIGVFRWQEVACSPACGSVYFERIHASRKGDDAEKKSRTKKEAYRPTSPTVETAEDAGNDMQTAEG